MKHLAALLVLVLMAGGCAAKNQSPDTPHDGGSTEWRLRTLEAEFLEFREERQRRDAESEDRLSEIDRDVADVRRDIDRVGEQTASAQADIIALRNAMEMRGTVTASLPDAAESGQQPEKTDESSALAAGSPEPATPAVGKPQASTPSREPAVPARKAVPARSASYAEGLALVRGGKTAEGRDVLEAFLQKNPGSGLEPNANYWIGESYYHEKDFPQSILTFRDVARRFPEHDKAAAALLKTGFAYQMLGDIANARFYLQALVDEYPDSEPSRLARRRLADLD